MKGAVNGFFFCTTTFVVLWLAWRCEPWWHAAFNACFGLGWGMHAW